VNDRPIFHEGELEAHRRAHEDDIAARVSKVIKPIIIAGAVSFIRQQSMVIAGSEDEAGNVWASILYGRPGFLDPSEDAKRLRIHLDLALPQPNDPLLQNLKERPEVGLLAIELSTRRRLKINGPVQRVGNTLSVDVAESYAICPKYIQKRDIQMLKEMDGSSGSLTRNGVALEEHHVEQIRRADTFFVASSHATYGPDVSHRGGRPGFVKVMEDGAFRIPDFRGNSMLSSFGNFTINPNAGLVFTDYETRRMLQLTGKASLHWDQPDAEGETGGTNRFWEFRTKFWLESEIPSSIQERFFEYSPFNP
jgi:predicted pyridoxine 5'-phosphate oxidase superfamily flavin-nucleotide-binding protein